MPDSYTGRALLHGTLIIFGMATSASAGNVAEPTPAGRSVVAQAADPWQPHVSRAKAKTLPYEAGAFTLHSAITRALAYSPALAAALLEVDARHGEVLQASFRPNPELNGTVENFAGSKDKRGFQMAESTLSLSQTIELGDKRLLRLEAAHLDATLATWDYEVTRVQLAAQVAIAYVDVIAAQDRLRVLNDFVSTANKTQAIVDARVNGGKASPIELDRAIVATARAKAQSKAEATKAAAARRRLAVFWGGRDADVAHANGTLGLSRNVPTLASLEAAIDRNPTLARWSDEIGRRVAQVNVEVSKARPDVKLGGGVRHFAENDSVAAVASVSIALPLFDRNTGNIIAAESRVAKAESDRAAARIDLVGTLAEALGDLDVAATQLRAFEKDVLPPAQSAFERTRRGYEEGKFDLLNVLDAQRAVFEVQLDLVTARAELEKARVKVEAIVGRDLGGL